LGEGVIWLLARKTPGFVKWWFRQTAVRNLPEGYDVDTHFKPRYNPWDQRPCLIPDADLYVAIGDGRADVVTDHIDHFDSTGIALKSGEHLDADIVVTATGLQLQALGGVVVSMDGAEIKPQDRFVYKAHMLEEVPNLFWCVGYTNASWTLRADMTARATAKLLAHMNFHGYTHAYPHLAGEPMPEKSAWDIQAGYVRRTRCRNPGSSGRGTFDRITTPTSSTTGSTGSPRPWCSAASTRRPQWPEGLKHNFSPTAGKDQAAAIR
jgi:cation diffusion facilitator CzcD-associated flavoprotein CzcO